MEWFKHSTGSHDDPDISDAIDEFGLSAYAVFFITLEVYGQEYNHLDSDGWLRLSQRFVARKLRISSTKVQQILNFYSERERILIKFDSSYVFIKCVKFIDIASNWTKRSVNIPTEASIEVATEAPTAKEEEEKKKKNRIEEYTIPFLSFWDSYPRKSGSKKAAFDAWKNLGKSLPDIDIILSSIMVQKGWSKNANGEFRPEWKDPERWLKNRMWESDFKTESKKAIGVPREDFEKCTKCGTRTFKGDLNESGICIKCDV
jgi:hypothetical protein